ncbi:hypothetical protein DYB26_006039 [Aphanomyces astaci]|uniref:Uncharacterized protein n=1 Tax=Aphanomyces astaci TaxID=112090 RepID=A0A397DD28_APHAT|nr:hypothetical protein DYB38_004666 [Aphanomyces astaci]RHZ39511.1 hypothetical protein DYB26_006039 [Aphanomyces astaci]RHZ41155.1 hypothetical protein DYB31_008900 [Aphanomyces astaci]
MSAADGRGRTSEDMQVDGDVTELVYHYHGDVSEEVVSTSWSCPCLDGSLEGIAEKMLAVFHETATEGKAEAFLTDRRADGELDTDFGIGKVALHIGNIVGVESLEEVYLAFPVSLHGAVHDRLAFVVEVSDARELKGYGSVKLLLVVVIDRLDSSPLLGLC